MMPSLKNLVSFFLSVVVCGGSSCGTFCTEATCLSKVRVSWEQPKGLFQVCIQENCAFSSTSESEEIVDLDSDFSKNETVIITIKNTSGEEVDSAEMEVEKRTPNGPNCPPACGRVTIRISDEGTISEL